MKDNKIWKYVYLFPLVKHTDESIPVEAGQDSIEPLDFPSGIEHQFMYTPVRGEKTECLVYCDVELPDDYLVATDKVRGEL